ncbi:hypothetical protein [Gimesia maris]|uniref:hypothetical protein n=1 Tax=Gimesia maris TaxID=122 RepID=UPI0030D8D4E1|tara:strand:- start:130565 stop:130909 length:345 start_codon:yes stop_codon:yes gene_type:complete
MTFRRVNGVNWRVREDVIQAIRTHTKQIGALQYRWVEFALIEKLQSEGIEINKLPEFSTPEVMEVEADDIDGCDFEIIDDETEEKFSDMSVEENMKLNLHLNFDEDDDFIYGSD